MLESQANAAKVDASDRSDVTLETGAVADAPENADWQVLLNLRPHHLFLREFQAAFLRTTSPEGLAQGSVDHQIEHMGADHPYVMDLLGVTQEETDAYVEKVSAFLRLLYDADDNQSIVLDIGPDAYCNAAVVGRHCPATNFTSDLGNLVNVVDGEREDLEKIRMKLFYTGAKYGRDYMSLDKTQHEVYDYSGFRFGNTVVPSLSTVEFEPLVVRVGALRNALPFSLT